MPVPESKVAPSGRPDAARATVKPAGSTAEKVKLAGFPKTASTSPGILRTGPLAGVIDTAALTAVAPNWTVIVELPDVARGSAYTLNVRRVCPGWLVMTAGIFRSGLALEGTKLADSGMLGEFN